MAFLFMLFALLTVRQVSAVCHFDNCFRGLQGSSHAASAAVFCSSYMAPGFTGSIPTYAAACSSSAVRVSSACYCLTAATSGPSSIAAAANTPTTSPTSSTTLSTSTTTLTASSITTSTCRVTDTQTVLITMPTCTSTTTSTASDTITSTVTATYTPYPSNVVLNGGFDPSGPGPFWHFTQNSHYQADGPGSPAHSGGYSAQVNATGPTLPDGSDAQDGILTGTLLLANSEAVPNGQYQLYAYYYILNAPSSPGAVPCFLSVSVQEQEVWSVPVYQGALGTTYSSFQVGVGLLNAGGTIKFDLSCVYNAGEPYAASVLIDDVYFFGAYVQCAGGQR